MKCSLINALLLCCLLFSIDVSAQSWLWAKGGIGGAGEAIMPAVDAWGNVYSAGYYAGADTFGSIVLPGSSSGTDVILVKYDPAGNVLWANRTSNGDALALYTAADNAGNVYELGCYAAASINIGTFVLNNPTPGKCPYFLAKYNTSGNVVWAENMGSTGFISGSEGACLCVKNGFVYLACAYANPVVTVGTYTLTNANPSGVTTDIFLAKVDTLGNVVWAKSMGGNDMDAPVMLQITPSSEIYMDGSFASTSMTFGSTTLYGGTNADFFAKFDPGGNAIWAEKLNDIGDFPINFAIDNNGDPVMVGGFLGTTTFGSFTLVNPSSYNSYMFIEKFDTSGNVLWAKEVSGHGTYGLSVAIDPCNNIWTLIVPNTSDTVDGHILSVPHAMLSGNYDPMFIVYFDSASNYITNILVPTGGDDAAGIATDGIGNITIGGDNYTGIYYTFGSYTIHDRNGGENIYAATLSYNSIADTSFAHTDTCIADSAIITAPPGFSVYLWSDGAVTQSREVYSSGIYWVYCSGACGRGLTIDTFNVGHGSGIVITESSDTTICDNSQLTLQAPPGYTYYLWSNGSTSSSLMVDSAGTYWVKAEANCTSAIIIDTFNIADTNIDISFWLGNDTFSCVPFRLSAPALAGANYVWQDGSTDASYWVKQSGIYYVTETDYGCSFSDTVSVSIPALEQHFRDTVLCSEGALLLTLTVNIPAGASVLWNAGSNNNSITIKDTGTYAVAITDSSCTVSDSMHVGSAFCDCKAVLPTAFTPNDDGKNDAYGPLIESGCPITNYMFAIYNRWGQQVFYSENQNDKWNGSFMGVKADVGVYMYYLRYLAGTKNINHMMKGDVTLIR